MSVATNAVHSPLAPPLPRPNQRQLWGRLYGASPALAIANLARTHPGLVLAVAADVQAATRLTAELGFFLGSDSDRKSVV